MKSTPSPECPSRNKPHAEHMFTVFGFPLELVGAHIDCPGMEK